MTVAVVTVIGFIADWGLRNDFFYMRLESLLLATLPFMGAVLAAVLVKIMASRKAALRVFCIAVIVLFAFVGTATVVETINTKPIVSAASTFKEPGLTREMGNNGDKFSPAEGFIPCIDIMGEGCPNITRTWIAAPDRELDVQDLQKVLDDSGWSDVKISNSHYCDMSDEGRDPYCEAEGMVGQYKATVSIIKIVDHWEIRMYLRLPTNAR